MKKHAVNIAYICIYAITADTAVGVVAEEEEEEE